MDRLLLAEDHARVAEEPRGLLAAEFDVVVTVALGNALLQPADDYQPDVVVTDIVMLVSTGSPRRWRSVRDGPATGSCSSPVLPRRKSG